jgi:UDP-sugar transporter A1/2/3
VRNIQLALIGLVVSGMACMARDGADIAQLGFFHAYDWTVYCTICLSALGGLVVAVVVKFADNVVKGFATAIALVISSVVSICILQDSDFNFSFALGGAMVVGSSVMYSSKASVATAGTADTKNDYELVSSSEHADSETLERRV